MDWSFLTIPILPSSAGAVAVLYIWLASRAFDRKYGRDDERRPFPGE